MCQSFWDVQYSKLKFGKGCHRKLKCIVWRSHVGARLRDSNMVAGNQWKHLDLLWLYLYAVFGCLKTFIPSV